MTTLKFNDYQGSASYEDGRIVVKILHIDDIIYDETTDATQVQAVFEELVKEYIATCKEVGREPCRPYKGSFNVRVSAELHRSAAMFAAQEGKSLNSVVEEALRLLLAREERVANTIEYAHIRTKQIASAGVALDDLFYGAAGLDGIVDHPEFQDLLARVSLDQRH